MNTEQINRRFPPPMTQAIMSLREKHACLIKLSKVRRVSVMRKALLCNYVAGQGRRKLAIPKHVSYKDNFGLEVIKDIYFSYINVKK